LPKKEVLLMTFETKLTNRSSATKKIFGLKGRKMTRFITGGVPLKEKV
jgi:hypothetical protein